MANVAYSVIHTNLSLGRWSGPHNTRAVAEKSVREAERLGHRVRIDSEPDPAIHVRVYDAEGACVHYYHPADDAAGVDAAARDYAERQGLRVDRVEDDCPDDVDLSTLNYTTSPACQGQIVETSYAVDAEREQIVRRTINRSDGAVTYEVAELDELNGQS